MTVRHRILEILPDAPPGRRQKEIERILAADGGRRPARRTIQQHLRSLRDDQVIGYTAHKDRGRVYYRYFRVGDDAPPEARRAANLAAWERGILH